MNSRRLRKTPGMPVTDLDEKPHSRQTICEIHRRMYRMIVARDPNDPLIPLLRKVFDIAKKMSNKLRRYKFDYDEGWWEVHKLDGGELDSDDADAVSDPS